MIRVLPGARLFLLEASLFLLGAFLREESAS
jgi:hypothetical protein